MPRTKKINEKTNPKSHATPRKAHAVNNTKLVTPSYTSLLYGVVTVIVLFALIFAGLRNFTHKASIPDIKDGIQTVNKSKIVQNTYTVKEGDNLWNIAVKEYNDGFQWKKIAQANELVNPGYIDKGMKLVIPKLPKIVAQVQPTITPVKAEITVAPNKPVLHPTLTQQNNSSLSGNTSSNGIPSGAITGKSYTVQHGDYLWEIAIRAYGNGYRWVNIMRANNLTNPDLIFSGNVLVIPR